MIAVCALAAAPFSARGADIIVSNLNQTNDGYDTIQLDFAAAQEFMTGSQSYVLTQILANLGGLDPGANNDFKLTATLQGDNGGNPGTVLTKFTYDISSIPSAGFAHVAFNPIASVILASGVNYWFVLSGSSSDGTGGVNWSFTNSTTVEGPGTLLAFNTSNDNGATWNGPFSGQPYQIQVSGPLVPEPASWIPGSLGLAGMFLAARCSRSRRRVD
jgi:hypothetical protein